jgi:type VI secretion system protein ImpA
MPGYDNIELLLQDIPGPAPQGTDLKYSPEYDQIKEASREDLDLPQGVWVQDLKSANWSEVEKICLEILQTKSKDLQVASWLIEAWISLYNITGLKQGFNVLLQLSQKYWDTAFPVLDPQDFDFRIAPYNWINEKLSIRFSKIEITAPDETDLLSYSYSTYIDIEKNGGITLSSSPQAQDASSHREGFEKSLQATKNDFFENFKKEGEETVELIKSLQSFLDEKLGTESPSLYHAQEKVQDLIAFCEQTLSTRQQSQENVSVQLETSINNTDPSPSDAPVFSQGTTTPVDVVMNSRSDAYNIINKAADYLEKLDPHSPSPHLIKRAIRWSNLDLKELLQEMVKDPSSLDDLKHLLGMNQETSEEEGS